MVHAEVCSRQVKIETSSFTRLGTRSSRNSARSFRFLALALPGNLSSPFSSSFLGSAPLFLQLIEDFFSGDILGDLTVDKLAFWGSTGSTTTAGLVEELSSDLLGLPGPAGREGRRMVSQIRHVS